MLNMDPCKNCKYCFQSRYCKDFAASLRMKTVLSVR